MLVSCQVEKSENFFVFTIKWPRGQGALPDNGMCCVEWFAGTLGRSSGGLAIENFCTPPSQSISSRPGASAGTKLQKFSIPAHHVATAHSWVFRLIEPLEEGEPLIGNRKIFREGLGKGGLTYFVLAAIPTSPNQLLIVYFYFIMLCNIKPTIRPLIVPLIIPLTTPLKQPKYTG